MGQKWLSEPELVKRDLTELEREIRQSAGSDPGFDTNRKLKEKWADRLKIILINHFNLWD